MAYQSLWAIQCQSHPSRRIVVVLFKVSLFNGISIFVGYFMPKPSSQKRVVLFKVSLFNGMSTSEDYLIPKPSF